MRNWTTSTPLTSWMVKKKELPCSGSNLPRWTKKPQSDRYYYPHPHVRRKMETLWLKSEGLPHHEICRLASISEPTLSQYLKEYQQGGIEQLKQLDFYQPKSELEAYTDVIKSHFQAHPQRQFKEAQAKIEELTGLKTEQTQIRAYLKAIGMKCRKVAVCRPKPALTNRPTLSKKNWNPACIRLKTVSGNCSLWMRRTLSWLLSWAFLWCFTRLFIQRRQVGSVSMSWGERCINPGQRWVGITSGKTGLNPNGQLPYFHFNIPGPTFPAFYPFLRGGVFWGAWSGCHLPEWGAY